jgi:hypothetical protein
VPLGRVWQAVRDAGSTAGPRQLERCVERSGWFQSAGEYVAFATRRFDIDPLRDPEMFVVIGGKFHGSWAWYPSGLRGAGLVPAAFVHGLGIEPTSHHPTPDSWPALRFRFCSDGTVRAVVRSEPIDQDTAADEHDWWPSERTRLVVVGPGRLLIQGLPPVTDSDPADVVYSHLDLPPCGLPPLKLAEAAMGLEPSSSPSQLLTATRRRAEPFRTAVHRLMAEQG